MRKKTINYSPNVMFRGTPCSRKIKLKQAVTCWFDWTLNFLLNEDNILWQFYVSPDYNYFKWQDTFAIILSHKYKADIILYNIYNVYNVNIYIYNECTNPTQILQIGHAAFIIFSFMCGQKDYKEGKWPFFRQTTNKGKWST